MIYLVVKDGRTGSDIICYFTSKEEALDYANEMNNREKVSDGSFSHHRYSVLDVKDKQSLPEQFYEVSILVYKHTKKIDTPMFTLRTGKKGNSDFWKETECLRAFQYDFHLDIIKSETPEQLKQRALEKFNSFYNAK